MNKNNECGCCSPFVPESTSSEKGLFGCLPDTKGTLQGSTDLSRKHAEDCQKVLVEAKDCLKRAEDIVNTNSNVTLGYVDEVKASLEDEINKKQDAGDYAEKSEIPLKLSNLENDLDFISKDEIYKKVDAVLPNQESFLGKFLKTDESSPYWSTYNALEENQITNCVLEIPQRIKYELKDGTLTVKAGTVIIVPYGIEAPAYQIGDFLAGEENDNNFKIVDIQYENNKLFYWCEIQRDITRQSSSASSGTLRHISISIEGNEPSEIIWNAITLSANSSNLPTDTSSRQIYVIDENKCIHTKSGGVVNVSTLSFPILRCIGSETNVFDSITQVFNGMGYIGSITWVDKETKVLIPDGRNEDGTLKNIEYTLDELRTCASTTFEGNFVRAMFFNFGTAKVRGGVYYYENSDYRAIDTKKNETWFNTAENRMYTHLTSETQWKPTMEAVLGKVESKEGTITNFRAYNAFRAVDYNQFLEVREQANNVTKTAYLTQTYINGTSGYRVWSDGYCEQWGTCNATAYTGTTANVTFLKSFKDTNYSALTTPFSTSNPNVWGHATYCVAKTKTNMRVHGMTNGNAGYTGSTDWRAFGYIS